MVHEAMNFYKAQAKMVSLLTGDIAKETLDIAEDEWENIPLEEEYIDSDTTVITSRDIPPGEDIKWMCGDCGATDWTPNIRRCKFCREGE